jgi:5-methylcytosine-specific restriction endonuclease McrA
MIPIDKNKVFVAYKSVEKDFKLHIERVKNKIAKWQQESDNLALGEANILCICQKEYLELLKESLPEVILADSEKLQEFIPQFESHISRLGMKKQFHKPFKDKLINILGYEELRSGKNSETPILMKFFKEIGLKSCVYCNAQLSVVIEKKGGKLSSNFQVDHYIDKASYPCFSISFFNLYPVCASCNNKKGNKEIGFQLYSENQQDLEKSPFEFEIDRASLANYRISRDYKDLKVHFNDQGSGLNEHMNVQDIYATQNDLAEEIIVKAEIYNKSYGNSLKKSFSTLYGSGGLKNLDFNRFIVGNYTDPKDIHKRPMSKFTQDIARQLKLIP